MPRLFIRHEPVDCLVEDSVLDNRFYICPEILREHGLVQGYGPSNTDVAYVCIVSHGKCWAARDFTKMGNKQVRIDCIPFNDNPSGQQILLADMILQ